MSFWNRKPKVKPEPKIHNLQRTTAHIEYMTPEGIKTTLRSIPGRSMGRWGFPGDRGNHRIQASPECMEYAMTKWWVRGNLFEIQPDVWIQHSAIQKVELTHEDYNQTEFELDDKH